MVSTVNPLPKNIPPTGEYCEIKKAVSSSQKLGREAKLKAGIWFNVIRELLEFEQPVIESV